jgi:hypothetical protein
LQLTSPNQSEISQQSEYDNLFNLEQVYYDCTCVSNANTLNNNLKDLERKYRTILAFNKIASQRNMTQDLT